MRRLSLFGLLLGLLLAVGWPAAGRAEGDWTVIGFSQAGVPLVVHRLGQGATRVLVMGGQHGGPEANTIELAEALLNHFAATPAELPPSVGLDVLVVANPDGAEVGSRQFLSGVDPNRNWGGSDWQRNAWDSNGVWTHDLGGPRPFSEPETRALRDFVLTSHPAVVINYHSAGGFMFGGRTGLAGELSQIYADASDYYFPPPHAPRLLSYKVNGSMGVWLAEQNVPGIFVELTSPWDAEIERNLAGLQAVLARLAANAGAPRPEPVGRLVDL